MKTVGGLSVITTVSVCARVCVGVQSTIHIQQYDFHWGMCQWPMMPTTQTTPSCVPYCVPCHYIDLFYILAVAVARMMREKYQMSSNHGWMIFEIIFQLSHILVSMKLKRRTNIMNIWIFFKLFRLYIRNHSCELFKCIYAIELIDQMPDMLPKTLVSLLETTEFHAMWKQLECISHHNGYNTYTPT